MASHSSQSHEKPKDLHQQILSCLQSQIDEKTTIDLIKWFTARPGPVELGRNQLKRDFSMLEIVDALCKHGKIKAGHDYESLTHTLTLADQKDVADEILGLIEEDKKRRLEADSASRSRTRGLKLNLRSQQPETGFLSPASIAASTKRKRYSSATPDSQDSLVEFDSVSTFPTYHDDVSAFRKLGLVLVVSNEFKNSSTVKPRPGSEKDKANIKKLFESEHYRDFYDLRLEDDVSVNRMKELIIWCREELSQKNKYASLWVFILTHGNKNGLIMEPGKRITADDDADIIPNNELYNKLKDTSGVPKVFIIQACRGDKFVERVEPDSADVDKPKIQFPDDDCADPEWVDHDGVKFLPPLHHADTLVCQATIKGFQSARSPKKGTWYIRALMDSIKRHRHESFLDVLTETQAIVTSRNGQSKNTGEEVRQVPKFNSTLRKKLYLLPRRLVVSPDDTQMLVDES